MHLQRLHVPIISIDAPHAAQLESDRTRNIETLQKSFLTKGKHTHTHTPPGCSCSVSNAQRIELVLYLAKKLKSQNQKSRQILFTLLCTLRIRAVGSSEKKDNTLKALVWRKIVNFSASQHVYITNLHKSRQNVCIVLKPLPPSRPLCILPIVLINLYAWNIMIIHRLAVVLYISCCLFLNLYSALCFVCFANIKPNTSEWAAGGSEILL